jgi:hypothetical protein
MNLESYIRFEDSSVEGGFRTVATHHATAGQYGRSLDLKKLKLQQLGEAVAAQQLRYDEIIGRAEGNPNRLLRDLFDVGIGDDNE